jgi:hypothetical protein
VADRIDKQQGRSINDLPLCGYKGQNQHQDRSGARGGYDPKDETQKKCSEYSPLFRLEANRDRNIQTIKTDQMQADDNRDSSDNEIPDSVGHTKETADQGSDGSQDGKRNRETKDKSQRIEERLASVSFRVAPNIPYDERNGCQDTRA